MATILFVQFADSTKKSIVSVFGCPQDADSFPNQGEVPSDDSRYVDWYNALPSAWRANGAYVDPGA